MLKQAVLRTGGVLAIAVLMLSVSTVPVFAHDGDGSSSGSGSTTTSGSHDGTETETETETEAEIHDSPEVKQGATTLLQKHKSDAATEVADLKKEKKSGHSAADLQELCTAHKDKLTAKAKRFAQDAAHHEATFDTMFTKVQTFHDTKQLTVADYDTLMAAVKAKQTVSASDVVALQTLSEQTIDCTGQDAAALYVSQLKASVTTAKTDLKAYRSALVDFIKAVRSAAGTAKSSTDDSDTSTTTGGQQ